MNDYKRTFISFLLEAEALKFGDFTLKSGRKSPFFMNIGDLNSGKQLLTLAGAYASSIYEHFGGEKMEDERPFNIVFGPAYKGIPLATAVSMQLEEYYHYPTRYCANRKEAKDHGDVGGWLGAKFKDGDRILMIEDVTTSGASMEETIPPIKEYAKKAGLDIEVVGLVVSLDRMEHGDDPNRTALETIADKYDMDAWAIVDMAEVVYSLQYGCPFDRLPEEQIEKIRDYYAEYGVKGKEVVADV